MPVKKENKRISYTATPYYADRFEKICQHTGKTKTEMINTWIDQYYMAFGHEMSRKIKEKKHDK